MLGVGGLPVFCKWCLGNFCMFYGSSCDHTDMSSVTTKREAVTKCAEGDGGMKSCTERSGTR